MSAIMRFINHLLYDICCTIVSNAHTSLNYFQRTIHYRTNIAITCIFLSPRIKFFTNNACEITVICFRWKIKYFYKFFLLQFYNQNNYFLFFEKFSTTSYRTIVVFSQVLYLTLLSSKVVNTISNIPKIIGNMVLIYAPFTFQLL